MSDTPALKKKKQKKDPAHYVDKQELWEEIKKAYEAAPDGEEIEPSDELAEMLYKICNKLAFKPCFINYQSKYNIDLASDAFVTVYKKLKERKFKLIYHKGVMERDEHGNVVMEKNKPKKILQYNPDGTPLMAQANAFGYMTQIAYNCFISSIKNEKTRRETIDNYQEKLFSEFEESDCNIRRRVAGADDEENFYYE